MSSFSTVIETGLILLIVFTTLALGGVHIWAYTLMELTVLLLVAIWFISMVMNGDFRIPKTPLNIPILLFICLILFQLIPLPDAILNLLSPNTQRLYRETLDTLKLPIELSNTISLNPYVTKMGLLKIMAYTGVFFLIVANITTHRQVRMFLTIIVITGFFISLFGLIQRFTWNGKIYWFIEFTPGAGPFGPFIYRNNFAAYIDLILPISLGLFMSERDRGKRILLGFMGVIMAVAVFFSLSRGGVIAFTGGMAFMGMLLLLNTSKGGYRRWWLILGGFLIAVLLYLIYLGIDPVIERLATLTDEELFLKEHRPIVWDATMKVVQDYPLLGTGLDTFETVFPRYQPLRVSSVRWDYAHNDYIQFMTETGIIGSLIGIIFFALLFKNVFTALNKSESITQNYLLIALLSSVVAFMLSIIFDFHTHIPADALLFTTLLGILVKLSSSPYSSSQG